VKIRLLTLLVFGCSLTSAACAVRRVHDYSFDVTGFVTAEDGAPLQNVEVILAVDTPIYEAIKPVKTQQLITNNGAFVFRCLSHDSATKYTVTVRKEGFEPQTVSGNAPPDGHLVFRLKKASSNGTAPQQE
jgi:outer membrane lipoprotein-sorting protein